MSLMEKNIIDKIEILENCDIQVRRANVIEKDGLEVARSFQRHVLHPGDDLTNEDPKVVAIATVLWTEEVIEAYQTAKELNMQ